MSLYIRVSRFDIEIRVPVVSPALYAELMRVEPSVVGDLEYRPCQVELNDGRVVDHVCVVEAVRWFSYWLQDPAGRGISILDVAHISESPTRLPVRLANTLYKKGETYMGGFLFSLTLRDGRKAHGYTGDVVDFLTYPPGVEASDVVGVLHGKSEGSEEFTDANWLWCLYGLPEAEANRKLKSLEAVFANTKVKWSFETDSRST